MNLVLVTVYEDKLSLSPMSLDKLNSNVLVTYSESGNIHIASSFEKHNKECISIPYIQFLKERYKCRHHEFTNILCKKDKYNFIREYQLEEGTVVVYMYN